MGTHKGFVQIWDATAGKKLFALEGHTARVGKNKKKTLKFIGQKCNTLFISGVWNVDSGGPLSCRAPTLKKPGKKYLTAS